MGTWGPGIYQNDVSDDVRGFYVSYLKGGKSDEEAYQMVMEKFQEELNDTDDRDNVIIGLAYIMWKYGRLNDEIKQLLEEALSHEENREWRTEKDRRERKKKIDKMLSDMSKEVPRKKVSVHKPYKVGWEPGEVYYFQLTNKYGYVPDEMQGWYALFLVVGINQEDWIVKGIYDEIAEVQFYMLDYKPDTIEDLYKSTPVCFGIGGVDAIGIIHNNVYNVDLCEKSARTRPKDLTLLGTIDKELIGTKVKKVSSRDRGLIFWNTLTERHLVWGYKDQLKLMAKYGVKRKEKSNGNMGTGNIPE